MIDQDVEELADEETIKKQKLVIDKMKDLVKLSVWVCFGRPNIDNFGGRYIEELSQQAIKATVKNNKWTKHLVERVIKFRQEQMLKYVDFLRN